MQGECLCRRCLVKKSLLVVCAVAFALVSLAGAQDSNFNGFYVGANVGGAFGTADARTSTVDTGTFFPSVADAAAVNAAGRQEISTRGILGGGTFGYNWRSDDNGLFLGLEADMGAMRVDDSATATGEYPCCAPDTFTIAQSIKTGWLFTVRPRMGYGRNNWVAYVTGGLAITDMDYSGAFVDTFGATEGGTMDDNNMGWTMGGGLEFAIPNSHWSLKGEYLFLNFGDITMTSTNLNDGVTAFPDTPFTHTTDLKMHTVRFGVNYRF